VHRAISQIVNWGPVEYQSALNDEGRRAVTISATYIVPALDSADTGVHIAELELRARTEQRVAQSAVSTKQASEAAVVGMVLALIVAAVIGIWLMRSILKPVVALEAGMQAVADGQLNYKLKYDTTKQHEFGRL